MLKILAIITMIIDHIGVFFAPYLSDNLYTLCRDLGRLAFPIYAYLIFAGYKRTSNVVHYFFRLLLFAGLAEVAESYAFTWAGESKEFGNIFLLLALGLVVLTALDCIWGSARTRLVRLKPIRPTATYPPMPTLDPRHKNPEGKLEDDPEDEDYTYAPFNPGVFLLPPKVGMALGAFLLFIVFAFVMAFEISYSTYGLLTIMSFYLVDKVYEEMTQTGVQASFPAAKVKIFLGLGVFATLNLFFLLLQEYCPHLSFYMSIDQCFAVLAIPCIYLVPEGEKPNRYLQLFYYSIYPLHLLIFGLVRLILA